MRRRVVVLASSALLAVAMLLVSGCGQSKELSTVSDASGLFHVRVPSQWQSKVQPGLLALYSADTLPTTDDEAFESLSIGVYTADVAGTEPVAERLTKLLDARAADRAWKSKRFSTPSKVTVGKRDGRAVDVTGTDSNGREFAGRAVLVRTNEREVLVFAVAPKNVWEDESDRVDDLFSEWYWHVPADRAVEPTQTAPQ